MSGTGQSEAWREYGASRNSRQTHWGVCCFVQEAARGITEITFNFCAQYHGVLLNILCLPYRNLLTWKGRNNKFPTYAAWALLDRVGIPCMHALWVGFADWEPPSPASSACESNRLCPLSWLACPHVPLDDAMQILWDVANELDVAHKWSSR